MHDGTMTLGQDLTLPTYRHLGGILNGTGNFTVLDSVQLTNGTIENNGTWNIGGSLTCSGGNLSGSGSMNVTGVTRLLNTTYLFYRTINMNGGGYTEANGRFYVHGGCQINLPSGKTFTILTSGYAPWHGWTAGGTISVAGTLIKNGPGQAHFVSPIVNMSGNVVVNQGSIDLQNPGTHSSLAMKVLLGTYVASFNGSHSFTNCLFEGNGSYYAAPATTLTMSGMTYSPGIAGVGVFAMEKSGFNFPITYLNVDVNSNAGPGTGNDKLHVIGNVTLNAGTVNVTDGGAPYGNYTILSYTGTRTGTFSTLNAPLGYSIIYDDGLKTVILNKSAPPDNDNDGYHAGIDCNDSDPEIYPGANEICNSLDDDCDGLIDDNDPGITGQSTWYVDTDNDGYGDANDSVLACNQPIGYVANADDCDDENPNIHPGAIETCNETDDDCDGLVDEGVQSTYYEDADQDGYGNSGVTHLACSPPAGFVGIADDCDDLNGSVFPGAAECVISLMMTVTVTLMKMYNLHSLQMLMAMDTVILHPLPLPAPHPPALCQTMMTVMILTQISIPEPQKYVTLWMMIAMVCPMMAYNLHSTQTMTEMDMAIRETLSRPVLHHLDLSTMHLTVTTRIQTSIQEPLKLAI
ncbi:MAG: putative metal-binding motif-containing protein [Saprospiraceae bacterium]|nr:putative metal-binding motif-containing protein [Candidatus Opimibacter skivensis]